MMNKKTDSKESNVDSWTIIPTVDSHLFDDDWVPHLVFHKTRCYSVVPCNAWDGMGYPELVTCDPLIAVMKATELSLSPLLVDVELNIYHRGNIHASLMFNSKDINSKNKTPISFLYQIVLFRPFFKEIQIAEYPKRPELQEITNASKELQQLPGDDQLPF